MKKLISFVLSIALLISVFCMSVSAANVVGTHGMNDNIDDGLSETAWNSSSSLTDVITLNVSGQHHRYAVDITFTGTFTFGTGQWIWDVNGLEYYQSASELQMSDTTYTFTVDNYSSKPINVSCEVTERDSYLDDAFIDISLTENITATNTHATGGETNADFVVSGTPNASLIEGLLKQVRTEGIERGQREKTSVTFEALMKSTSTESSVAERWNTSVGKYLMYGNEQGIAAFTLARFTVTVSKVIPTP